MKRRLLVLFGASFLMTILVLALIHSLESNAWSKASTIETGMTTNQVRQIMGEPKRISRTPNHHTTEATWVEKKAFFEEWHYDGPRKFRVNFSLRPFRISMPEPDDWITIGFTEDEKVFSVWIPME